jgi:hypothetical protein
MIHTHALCTHTPFYGHFKVGTIYSVEKFVDCGSRLIHGDLINFDEWHLRDEDGHLFHFRKMVYDAYFEDATALVRERKIDDIMKYPIQ